MAQINGVGERERRWQIPGCNWGRVRFIYFCLLLFFFFPKKRKILILLSRYSGYLELQNLKREMFGNGMASIFLFLLKKG